MIMHIIYLFILFIYFFFGGGGGKQGALWSMWQIDWKEMIKITHKVIYKPKGGLTGSIHI